MSHGECVFDLASVSFPDLGGLKFSDITLRVLLSFLQLQQRPEEDMRLDQGQKWHGLSCENLLCPLMPKAAER